MRALQPERGLERLLFALERDLLDASDEEILAAARELGMNPAMKGSAAFFGVTLVVGVPRKALRRKRLDIARRGLPKDDPPRKA
jgi:hypothetical protein